MGIGLLAVCALVAGVGAAELPLAFTEDGCCYTGSASSIPSFAQDRGLEGSDEDWSLICRYQCFHRFTGQWDGRFGLKREEQRVRCSCYESVVPFCPGPADCSETFGTPSHTVGSEAGELYQVYYAAPFIAPSADGVVKVRTFLDAQVGNGGFTSLEDPLIRCTSSHEAVLQFALPNTNSRLIGAKVDFNMDGGGDAVVNAYLHSAPLNFDLKDMSENGGSMPIGQFVAQVDFSTGLSFGSLDLDVSQLGSGEYFAVSFRFVSGDTNARIYAIESNAVNNAARVDYTFGVAGVYVRSV